MALGTKIDLTFQGHGKREKKMEEININKLNISNAQKIHYREKGEREITESDKIAGKVEVE